MKLDANVPSFAWWGARRLRYNLALVIAAPISAICLFLVWWLFEDRLPCLEITGFSLVLWGVLFFVGLALANLCYFLGPLAEKVVRPRNVARFRAMVFAMGLGISLSIIVLPVIANLVAAALYPAGTGNCIAHEP